MSKLHFPREKPQIWNLKRLQKPNMNPKILKTYLLLWTILSFLDLYCPNAHEMRNYEKKVPPVLSLKQKKFWCGGFESSFAENENVLVSVIKFRNLELFVDNEAVIDLATSVWILNRKLEILLFNVRSLIHTNRWRTYANGTSCLKCR